MLELTKQGFCLKGRGYRLKVENLFLADELNAFAG